MSYSVKNLAIQNLRVQLTDQPQQQKATMALSPSLAPLSPQAASAPCCPSSILLPSSHNMPQSALQLTVNPSRYDTSIIDESDHDYYTKVVLQHRQSRQSTIATRLSTIDNTLYADKEQYHALPTLAQHKRKYRARKLLDQMTMLSVPPMPPRLPLLRIFDRIAASEQAS